MKLVITVDCGSRNHEVIEELGEKKIDVIVTDHHECGDIAESGCGSKSETEGCRRR